MFKRMKYILPALTIIGSIGVTSINVDAFEGAFKSNLSTQSSLENLEYEESELRPLDYTIDEIRQMTMAEYYSKCFPEIWETCTPSEKEEYSKIKYSDLDEASNRSIPIVNVFVASGAIESPSKKTAKGQVVIMGDGSVKASRMDISYILYDSTGATYAGGSGGKSNATYYGMKFESRVIPSGKKVYVESVNKLKFNSNSATQTVKYKSNTVTVK